MYEKIMALLNQGVMDWEGVRTILQVPDYGEDYILFNEVWSQAMGDFADKHCYLEEDERVGVRDGKGFFKGTLVGMGF